MKNSASIPAGDTPTLFASSHNVSAPGPASILCDLNEAPISKPASKRSGLAASLPTFGLIVLAGAAVLLVWQSFTTADIQPSITANQPTFPADRGESVVHDIERPMAIIRDRVEPEVAAGIAEAPRFLPPMRDAAFSGAGRPQPATTQRATPFNQRRASFTGSAPTSTDDDVSTTLAPDAPLASLGSTLLSGDTLPAEIIAAALDGVAPAAPTADKPTPVKRSTAARRPVQKQDPDVQIITAIIEGKVLP